ncbi:hypothetical protein [Nodularia sp. NIES-3585]|uniref:hypothetical protein n=1 Tax=Nodularia sp. NIES-3585 TaxID=1973477 RepID=UPI000B5CC49E|nr:hypothetical protein [Nodularia sp. NIES-3585]GAX36128.1 hypothetical protein NIES3585_21540 [Nodularia sp. NIES-3585]
MNSTNKLAIFLFAVFASVFGLATQTLAGEGGAAGAVAFTIESGMVTGVAQAAAIGKNDAAATAFNVFSITGARTNSASALGSAGAITISNLGNSANVQMVGTADPALHTAQHNQFSSNVTINLGTSSGNQLINF